MSIPVKLFVFAGLREILDTKSEIDIQLPKSEWQSDDELKLFCLNHLKETRLQELDPGFTKSNTSIDRYMSPSIYMLAINECYVDGGKSLTINEMDHIALLQPVSGGW